MSNMTQDRDKLAQKVIEESELDEVRASIEVSLITLVNEPTGVPENLQNAMRHALLAPSKRIRPLMVYFAANPSEPMVNAALRVGSAVEMVHTASLIFDDLPCMDDAQMRRHRPTAHIAFGQSTAILGAIALLTRAFGLISEIECVSGEIRAKLNSILSKAVGWNGLVAGQELDINGQRELSDSAAVENLSWLKTGVLFVAAAEMGAVLRDATDEQVNAARRYATHFGLAFQTLDDVLDHTANTGEIGKDVKKDSAKTTLVNLFGLSQAKRTYEQHLMLADKALLESGAMVEPLRQLSARLFSKAQLS
jgi:geranylgeranyl diphosphate synthase, type II